MLIGQSMVDAWRHVTAHPRTSKRQTAHAITINNSVDNGYAAVKRAISAGLIIATLGGAGYYQLVASTFDTMPDDTALAMAAYYSRTGQDLPTSLRARVAKLNP